MKIAEEYLRAADILHGRALFNPSVYLAHGSALHAVQAAFLTAGAHGDMNFSGFIDSLARFDDKLKPLMERLRNGGSHTRSIIEYDEKESFLRLHQTKELLTDVKYFLKRAMR